MCGHDVVAKNIILMVSDGSYSAFHVGHFVLSYVQDSRSLHSISIGMGGTCLCTCLCTFKADS